MYENTVVLTKDEYANLVRKAERISVLQKFVKESKYVSLEEVAWILGIELKGTDDE
jgi:hypothetical protein